jgi:hypothetical protein
MERTDRYYRYYANMEVARDARVVQFVIALIRSRNGARRAQVEAGALMSLQAL